MAKFGSAQPVDNYQAQSDMHTLMEAHAIKKDGKRHAAAKAHAKTKLAGMKALVEDSPAEEKTESSKKL